MVEVKEKKFILGPAIFIGLYALLIIGLALIHHENEDITDGPKSWITSFYSVL